MRLESRALDDLHAMAAGEFANDPEAILVLNVVYETAKTVYIAVLRLLRVKAEERS